MSNIITSNRDVLKSCDPRLGKFCFFLDPQKIFYKQAFTIRDKLVQGYFPPKGESKGSKDLWTHINV